MSYKFEELKGTNSVVHVPTKEIANQIENILVGHLRGAGGGNYTRMYWNNFREKTCYSLHNSSYCNIEWFKNKGCTIISAEDFIRDNTIEKPNTFRVEGSPNLIKAFVEELVELGFIVKNDNPLGIDYRVVCNNHSSPKDINQYKQIFISTRTHSGFKEGEEATEFQLPKQYNEALKYAEESLNSPYWKMQEELPAISGYRAEPIKNGIKFGCQEFSNIQLETYVDLLKRKEFKATITINKEEITLDMLNKLLSIK